MARRFPSPRLCGVAIPRYRPQKPPVWVRLSCVQGPLREAGVLAPVTVAPTTLYFGHGPRAVFLHRGQPHGRGHPRAHTIRGTKLWPVSTCQVERSRGPDPILVVSEDPRRGWLARQQHTGQLTDEGFGFFLPMAPNRLKVATGLPEFSAALWRLSREVGPSGLPSVKPSAPFHSRCGFRHLP